MRLERNDLVPPLVKSAAEFMGGINTWQDFYSLVPGLYTSAEIQYYSKMSQVFYTPNDMNLELLGQIGGC